MQLCTNQEAEKKVKTYCYYLASLSQSESLNSCTDNCNNMGTGMVQIRWEERELENLRMMKQALLLSVVVLLQTGITVGERNILLRVPGGMHGLGTCASLAESCPRSLLTTLRACKLSHK